MGTIADTLVDIRIKNNDVYVQLKHILTLRFQSFYIMAVNK